jgi:hypothetical protein
MLKITERTLYEPISTFLEQNLKTKAIHEVGKEIEIHRVVLKFEV